MCASTSSAQSRVDVPVTAVAEYRRRGYYATRLSVSTQGAAPGDSLRFRRIGDALAVARAGRLARGEQLVATCPIVIEVGPGVYRGDVVDNADATVERFPLVIDVPSITLKGAFAMQRDSRGRALGTSSSTTAVTTLQPVRPLQISGGGSAQTGVSPPLVLVHASPDASAGHGATIEGFVFQSGHVGVDTLTGGQGIFAMRVENLTVRGNKFEARLSEAIDLRASSGTVVGNHLGGSSGTCDICVAGPGVYRVADNRLLAGGIPGILLVPALNLPMSSVVVPFVLPASVALIAVVENNEVRDHLRKPVGVGIRVGAIGNGAPNVAGISRVEIRDNTLLNNNFGVIVEAAFPVANSLLRGDVDVTLLRNLVQQSCQRDLLVSLSRHTTGLGLANAPYARGSTFRLTLDNAAQWDDAWFSHPVGFGNTLVVNDQGVANGTRAAYDAARTCAPLP